MSGQLTYKELIGHAALFGVIGAFNPTVGPWGGALIGGVGYILGRPVRHFCDENFGANEKNATTLTKIASWATSFFVGTGLAALFAKNAFGVDVSYNAAIGIFATAGALGTLAFVASVVSVVAGVAGLYLLSKV